MILVIGVSKSSLLATAISFSRAIFVAQIIGFRRGGKILTPSLPVLQQRRLLVGLLQLTVLCTRLALTQQWFTFACVLEYRHVSKEIIEPIGVLLLAFGFFRDPLQDDGPDRAW